MALTKDKNKQGEGGKIRKPPDLSGRSPAAQRKPYSMEFKAANNTRNFLDTPEHKRLKATISSHNLSNFKDNSIASFAAQHMIIQAKSKLKSTETNIYNATETITNQAVGDPCSSRHQEVTLPSAVNNDVSMKENEGEPSEESGIVIKNTCFIVKKYREKV